MLDTGVPNFYSPSPPPLITGASSMNPLLVPAPSNLKPSGALPPAGSGPCSGTVPCILTAQFSNARENVNVNEDVFTTANVATGGFGASKGQFLVIRPAFRWAKSTIQFTLSRCMFRIW